ncbi:autotransporter outer membrane beta-barrel domain-containing protein [Lysobacter olei]
MTGGRDSAFALNISLPAGSGLDLGLGTSPGDRYVFGGGTAVTGGGYLRVSAFNALVSNVTVDGFSSLFVDGNIEGNILVQPTFTPDLDNGLFIQPGSTVRGSLDNAGLAALYGQLTGNVTNNGELYFAGRVNGDVANSGRMVVTGFPVLDSAFGTIDGNFSQTSGGTLAFQLAPNDPAFQAGPLQITGQAQLGGTLELSVYTDSFGPYPLPAAGSKHIIHANGGVFGQFAQWTSPGLFLEGSVRYASNDVWFDLIRISMQAVMAANASTPQILASAANLDRAFDTADAYAQAAPDTLNTAQRQLLASAGSVLRIDDVAQATRTLDSLSGQSFTDIHDGLLDSFAQFGPQWSQRQQWRDGPETRHAWMAMATPSGATGNPGMMQDGRSETGVMSGVTYPLGPQWLVGVAMGRGDAWMAHERDGRTRAVESLGMLYGHAWRGPWHAYAEVRGSRGQVDTWRHIDLGDRRAHPAAARFDMVHVRARLEGGFDQAVGDGQLTPFAALQHDTVHSGAFTEMGDTGLELLGQSASSRRTSAELGLRYLRDWKGTTGWLRLAASAAHRHALRADGGVTAAFTGAPDVMFRINDASRALDRSWFDLQLDAGRGAWWSTYLRYRWSVDDVETHRGWWLGIERKL